MELLILRGGHFVRLGLWEYLYHEEARALNTKRRVACSITVVPSLS